MGRPQVSGLEMWRQSGAGTRRQGLSLTQAFVSQYAWLRLKICWTCLGRSLILLQITSAALARPSAAQPITILSTVGSTIHYIWLPIVLFSYKIDSLMWYHQYSHIRDNMRKANSTKVLTKCLEEEVKVPLGERAVQANQPALSSHVTAPGYKYQPAQPPFIWTLTSSEQ